MFECSSDSANHLFSWTNNSPAPEAAGPEEVGCTHWTPWRRQRCCARRSAPGPAPQGRTRTRCLRGCWTLCPCRCADQWCTCTGAHRGISVPGARDSGYWYNWQSVCWEPSSAGRKNSTKSHSLYLSLIPFFPFLNTVFKAKHAQNQSKLLFALRNEKGFVMKTKLLFTSTRHKLHHLIKCFLKPSDFCYKLNLDKPQKNMFYKLPSVISNRAFTFEFMFQKVWTHPPLKRLQELMHDSGTAKSQRRPYSCMCRDGTPPPPLSAWLAGLLQASSITLALPSNWKSCFSNDSRSEQHILRPAPMLRHFLSHRIQTAWAPIC